MQQRTLEQQIAEAEARLARLRTQSRQLENGQKIILGGMLLAAARHNSKIRAWVIKEAGKAVSRDVDNNRLQRKPFAGSRPTPTTTTYPSLPANVTP
jgi:hypothetical protein